MADLERLGWFGPLASLLHFLATVRADQDGDGNYLVGGQHHDVAVGLGGQDVVVGPVAVYFVDGAPHGLASELRGTSYGMAIVVI